MNEHESLVELFEDTNGVWRPNRIITRSPSKCKVYAVHLESLSLTPRERYCAGVANKAIQAMIDSATNENAQ